MTDRRFTDKPDLDPGSVLGLPPTSAALRENRTLFPSTVIEVTQDKPDRILVSGEHSRKLGKTVTKGIFAGYAIYGLTLEERATCPEDCAVRDLCYGNGMQYARRHRIGDPEVFYDRLGLEILDLLEKNPRGILIRLHVLGDFQSVEYVSFWADILNENPAVAIYGYTAHKTTAWGGGEIGGAIEAVKERFPSRFRIRWSSEASRPDGAVVIGYTPSTPTVAEGVVCPAQTEDTGCCASCALCWALSAKHQTIAFIKHGRHSVGAAAVTAMSEAKKALPVPLPKPREVKTPIASLDRDELEERLEQLEEALKDTGWLPPGWGLTKQEAELVGILARKNGEATKEQITTLMWGHEVEGGPEPKTIDIIIRRIRKKLGPFGIEIETMWGQGYRVSAGLKIIMAAKNGEAPPSLLEGSALAEPVENNLTRAIRPIPMPKKHFPAPVSEDRPEVRMVSPLDLCVEPAYQRDLSGPSISLIRKIVAGWDWAKFKPPVCADTPDGLFIIDGQHTAIAAATHPAIAAIPVLVVKRELASDRAEAFVAQNRDRVAMSVLQVFHAELAAGVEAAVWVARMAKNNGLLIPRSMPRRGAEEIGTIVGIGRAMRLFRKYGPQVLARIFQVAAASRRKLINSTVLDALAMIQLAPAFAATASLPDDILGAALGAIEEDIDRASQALAGQTGQSRVRACAALIREAAERAGEAQ